MSCDVYGVLHEGMRARSRRRLHCPMCRVGSAISKTIDSLRWQHGCDDLSETMRLARSERNLVSSTALEASRVQAPRAFYGACQELIDRAGPISPSYRCLSTPGAQRGSSKTTSRTPWPVYTTQFRAHTMARVRDTVCFRAMAVLPEGDSVNLYEREADQRALNGRIETSRLQL